MRKDKSAVVSQNSKYQMRGNRLVTLVANAEAVVSNILKRKTMA